MMPWLCSARASYRPRKHWMRQDPVSHPALEQQGNFHRMAYVVERITLLSMVRTTMTKMLGVGGRDSCGQFLSLLSPYRKSNLLHYLAMLDTCEILERISMSSPSPEEPTFTV